MMQHPTAQCLIRRRHRVVINYIIITISKYNHSRINYSQSRTIKKYCVVVFSLLQFLFFPFYLNSYAYNEVGYGSPYGYSPSVTTPQTMGYELSADYVDSTTTYEPRSTIMDSDFIGGHSKQSKLYQFLCKNYGRKLFNTTTLYPLAIKNICTLSSLISLYLLICISFVVTFPFFSLTIF